MAIIGPSLPTVGGPRGDGEVALRNDISTLLSEFNGNIDDANIKSGAAIDGAKLAAASIHSDRLAVPGIVAAGKSIIATSQSRTNAGYGLLATADQVSGIVLPADGVLFVLFQALWQSSAATAGRAALFLGTNQLKVAQQNIGAPAVQEASDTNTSANVDASLFSYARGLSAVNANTGAQSQVTTGQVIGSDQQGGVCAIFAAAGTYDVSVQFKSSSGSVTVKNRKLWVWAQSFA